jgi:hypothetical protein
MKMDMQIVIDRLVNGGVFSKSNDDDYYTMNNGNYTLTVYNGESNHEIHDLYRNDAGDYFGIAYDENGCDTHFKLSYSNMMLVKVTDIMTL